MEHDSSLRKVVVFEVGEENYAIDIQFVKSIERLLPITPLPQSSESILGVIDLRDKVLPIVDLKYKLGKGKVIPSDQTRILIVNKDGVDVGLIVDDAKDVIDLDSRLIDAVTMGSFQNEYIDSIVKLESLIVLLNLGPIMDIKELREIEGQRQSL